MVTNCRDQGVGSIAGRRIRHRGTTTLSSAEASPARDQHPLIALGGHRREGFRVRWTAMKPVNDLPPRQRPACQLPTGCSLFWAGLVAEASLERS